MNQSIPTTIPSSSHAHNPFAQSSSQGHVSTSFPRPASFQRSWSGRGIGSSTGMDIGSGKPESGLSQMMKQSDQGSPASSGVPASSPIGIGGKHSLGSNMSPPSFPSQLSPYSSQMGMSSSFAPQSFGMGMSISPPAWRFGTTPGSFGGNSFGGGMGMVGSFGGGERARELEARYVRDFTCCGRQLGGLHDLLEHYEEEHANVPSDVRKAALTAAQASALAMSNNPAGSNPSGLPTPITTSSIPPNRNHIPNPEGEPPDMDDMDIEMEDAPGPTPSALLGNQRQQPRSGTVTPSASPWSVFQNAQNQNHQLPPGGIPQCVPPSVLSYSSNNPPPTASGNILNQTGGAARFGGGIGLAGLLTPQQQADKAAKKLARKMEKEREKREGHGSDSGGEGNAGKEKKFRCPVEGCGKSYKQANGLKYHLQRSINSSHGHLSDIPIPKPTL